MRDLSKMDLDDIRRRFGFCAFADELERRFKLENEKREKNEKRDDGEQRERDICR